MNARSSVKTRISREAVTRIASQLARLAEGQSKPVPLPPERELVQRLAVGRRAVRLAIDLLVDRGLVERKHGSGNYLLPKRFSVTASYLVIPADIRPDDPFYSSLIGQFALYAREHQIQLLPVRLDRQQVLNRQLPGIILAKLPKEQLDEVISCLRTVIALTDLDSDCCCQLFFDDYAIGQEAARRIAEMGHSHALVLTGPQAQTVSARRVEGFRHEAQKVGLGMQVAGGEMSWRGGYDLMKGYLAVERH